MIDSLSVPHRIMLDESDAFMSNWMITDSAGVGYKTDLPVEYESISLFLE